LRNECARAKWLPTDREKNFVLAASVSADHRVVDGRRAGQFLAAIDRWLQTPEQV
jgi:pyruvate/2-oxoglutarate dehydrogenase complex dihydrolipoamide acyltransferase (E2) component